MALKKEKAPPAPTTAPAKEAAAEGTEAPKKKSGKLKLIIIVVAAMAIGGGGAFLGLKLLGGGSAPPAEVQGETAAAAPAHGEDSEAPIEAPKRAGSEAAAPAAHGGGGEGEGAAAAEMAGPQNIEFKPFIANLGDGGGKRFLKLTMSVEAETLELAAEINQKMPQFRDLILMLLSSLSYDDISTLDGKMRLRNQMLNRINTQLSSGKVKNIYFSEFVVQ